ncbi:exodeoxyribonuclease VII small subunit [Cytobacillus suaedae]|uniref:Exodeoxyribonuclease 7 small subunit n=1 Tax=Litchfieldia luteola TaxID=682179 RepID=A0ABR9QPK8_9BACI|nr:exodeoxyribonuclease VII small subunit [Cytobacillus luteolus]MBE4910445.1 exodeoxyribonuclease VII small subunit [Cytobacillus luteolus]MBP1941979.1 exodeoxyribonuclease VII small subunit [Cytobacillus luteolus]QOR65420.1 exodeoxyribonuclease VII small subunit [Cytobacillus suaedae]
MTEEKQMTFEDAMEKLEEIVERLEEGDVPLEKAISYFQEGMKLSKLCHDKLQNVEKQMDQILREDGKLEPFTIQGDE